MARVVLNSISEHSHMGSTPSESHLWSSYLKIAEQLFSIDGFVHSDYRATLPQLSEPGQFSERLWPFLFTTQGWNAQICSINYRESPL